jgi:hypothetical protein
MRLLFLSFHSRITMMQLVVVKGCRKIGIKKGDILNGVSTVKGEGGFNAVTFNIGTKRRTMYTRFFHKQEFNMNTGDPTTKIRVRAFALSIPEPPPQLNTSPVGFLSSPQRSLTPNDLPRADLEIGGPNDYTYGM